MKYLIIMGIMIFTLRGVHAGINQCEVITKDQAIAAFNLIKKADIYDFTILDQYCEACLDDYPKPLFIQNYKVQKNGKGFSLFLNGEPSNLAYLYSGGSNLAQEIGCKTVAVSKYLE